MQPSCFLKYVMLQLAWSPHIAYLSFKYGSEYDLNTSSGTVKKTWKVHT